MKLSEAKQKLNDAEIYQLNQGESLRDALDHIDNGSARKGYRVKTDSGRMLTENEIIHYENKAAFEKSFIPAQYSSDGEYDDPEDVSTDLREDKSVRGLLCHCYYCGTSMRIDGWDGGTDYEENVPEVHCEDCFSDAIMNLCM